MANQNNSSNEGLDFENTLWAAADQLRGHMDAAEYMRDGVMEQQIE